MGSVVVRAKLQNRAWQNVPPDSVRLIVKENMMFMPNLPVFIIPLTYMDYTVWRKKQGGCKVESEDMESIEALEQEI